jgi:hypothetical protein
MKSETFEQLKQATIDKRGFTEVSKNLFFEAMGAVPPISLPNNTWQMGECVTRDMYYTFGCNNGKYYGCLCNANFSINNF